MHRLGNYVLEDKLGMGATADVFKAIQPGVERTVAIKVMHPHVAGDAQFIARFQREARAMGQLQHPHISRVIDFESSGEHPFIVMEYLSGGSLRDLLDNTAGRLPIDYSVGIVRQLADALSYAHSMGTVHRDMKPANVMFSDTGARHAVLTDFGIARLAGEAMTMTGTLLGTPAYIAPEQVRGEGADAPADQYSLGVMLYELVTGQLPFKADSLHALMLKQATDEPPSPRALNPQISPALDTLILRAMAKDPADRFPSSAHMRDALDALGSGAPGSGKPGSGKPGSGKPGSGKPATVVATVDQDIDASAGGSTASPKARLVLAVAGLIAIGALTVVGLSQLGGNDDPAIEVADATVGADQSDQLTEAPQPTSTASASSASSASSTAAPVTAPAAPDIADESSQPSGDTAAEVSVPSFDPANPPALVPSTARIDGTRFTANFEHSREAAEGSVYVAWLDSVEGPVGELVIDRAGQGQLVADLPGVLSARSFVITEEAAASAPTAPTGPVVFERRLSTDAIALLDAGLAAVENIETQFAIAVDHDGFIQDEIAAGNLPEVRRHAEHLVNILDGETGSSFGDLDGDAMTQNPGDGVGVRVYAEQVATALTAPDLDSFAGQVIAALPVYKNIANGASQPPFDAYLGDIPIEDLAPQVAAARAALEADVARALLLGDRFADPEAAGRAQASLLAGGETIAIWDVDSPGAIRREPADSELMTSVFGPALVEVLGLQQQDAAALVVQVQIAIDHVELMQNEIALDNHAEVRRHAEHVVNILDGAEGQHFGDLDNDGSVQNPGDGVGVLVYLDRLQDRLAALPSTTDAQLLTQAAWVAAVDRMRVGAVAALGTGLRIIATDSPAEAAPSVQEVGALLIAVRDGSDADEDGVISLYAGELGAAELGFQAATLLTVPVTSAPS